jgi:hypothetical protein
MGAVLTQQVGLPGGNSTAQVGEALGPPLSFGVFCFVLFCDRGGGLHHISAPAWFLWC